MHYPRLGHLQVTPAYSDLTHMACSWAWPKAVSAVLLLQHYLQQVWVGVGVCGMTPQWLKGPNPGVLGK